MTLYEDAVRLTNQLSLLEKVRLLEHLSSALQQDLSAESYKQIPWEQFVDLTYGSLADDPLERDQPPLPDDRDEIL